VQLTATTSIARASSLAAHCLAALLGVLGAAVPAHAQETPPATAGAPTLDYSVIDRATVRVFAVHGVGTARIPTSSGGQRLLALPESSHGSGLLVSADGLIVTARHVVDDGTLLAVWVPGIDRAFEAQVVHEDATWDLAVIAIQGTFPDFVPLAPLGRALRIREQVSAIGYPLDASRIDPQSAQGIVAGVLPSGELQLDIGVNPGNSGGPLIDAQERVVGMVVARGDVAEGVQSIGVAVPVDPIAQLLTTLTPDHGQVATARLSLANRAHGTEVAELVQILVRVRGTELFRDVERALEGRGTGEVLARLRRLADQATDAETMVMLAAYLWDAAALVLERNGGALRPSQLAAGADRDLANDLLRHAVRLCFEAQRRDLAITSRSPFVAWVTHYLREPSTDEPFVAPPPPAAGRTPPPRAAATGAAVAQARDAEGQPARPRTPAELIRDRDHRLHVSVDILLPFAGRNTAFAGLLSYLGVWASPYTLRVGPVAFDLVLGGSLGLHFVGTGMLANARVYLGLDLGASMRIGDVNGFVVSGTWSPAVVAPFGYSPGGALGSGRLRAGAQIGSVHFGLEWHGLQVEGDYVIHAFGLFVSTGFLS